MGKFGELTRFKHLVKEKFGKLIDQPIVGTNLDGFSLANH